MWKFQPRFWFFFVRADMITLHHQTYYNVLHGLVYHIYTTLLIHSSQIYFINARGFYSLLILRYSLQNCRMNVKASDLFQLNSITHLIRHSSNRQTDNYAWHIKTIDEELRAEMYFRNWSVSFNFVFIMIFYQYYGYLAVHHTMNIVSLFRLRFIFHLRTSKTKIINEKRKKEYNIYWISIKMKKNHVFVNRWHAH